MKVILEFEEIREQLAKAYKVPESCIERNEVDSTMEFVINLPHKDFSNSVTAIDKNILKKEFKKSIKEVD